MVQFVLVAARLRGVNLPFPDVKEAEAALVEPEAPAVQEAAPAPVEQAAPEAASDSVSAWKMPTLAPDPVVSGTDAFKHPSQAMLKDWETAPKIDMFDAPKEQPVEAAQVESGEPAPEKKPEAALPAVASKLHPVNPYGPRDSDPELAAIQKENPDAYGLVKALLMKKQMGLPLPGAEAAQNARQSREDMGGSRQDPDAATAHINNMWNWKPTDSASDEVSVTQEMSDTQEAPAPTEAAPAAVEAPAPEPVAQEVEAPAAPEPAAQETPAAPAAEAPAPATGGLSLSSWLGGMSKASAPVEQVQQQQEVQVPKQAEGLMSKYAMDLA